MIKVVCVKDNYWSVLNKDKAIKMNDIYLAEYKPENSKTSYVIYSLDNNFIGYFYTYEFITYNEWIAIERERKINEILNEI